MNKEKISTLIVSDIHLGSRLSRADKLIQLFEKYDFQKLILNGDILDGFNFKRLQENHWDFLSYLRKLSSEKEIIWVEGNHDLGADNLSVLIGAKVYKQYIWKENNKKFLAIHGHQFDRFGNKNFILGGIGNIFYFIFHSLLGKRHNYGFWAEKIDGKWLRMSEQVARGALYYAKLKGVDYVFCGHTHIVKESHLGKIKYYNSGSWDQVPSGYLIIRDNEVIVGKNDY
jgi:predicted phosphodiesterase